MEVELQVEGTSMKSESDKVLSLDKVSNGPSHPNVK